LGNEQVVMGYEEPQELNMVTTRRMLSYFKSMMNYGLFYPYDGDSTFTSYVDVDGVINWT